MHASHYGAYGTPTDAQPNCTGELHTTDIVSHREETHCNSTCSLGLWVLGILLQPLHKVLHCMKCLSELNIGEGQYHIMQALLVRTPPPPSSPHSPLKQTAQSYQGAKSIPHPVHGRTVVTGGIQLSTHNDAQ